MWIDRAARQLGVGTRWLPFELHPDTPLGGAPKPFSDDQWPQIRARLVSLAQRVGVPIDPPRRNVNSRMALEIGELVRDARGDDAMRDFHHAISRAFFVDGANIAEAGVVERFAAEAGVVQKLVRTAWRERRFRAAVDASIASSVERGVQGVPAYGFADGPIISGMMEPRAILRGLSAGPSP